MRLHELLDKGIKDRLIHGDLPIGSYVYVNEAGEIKFAFRERYFQTYHVDVKDLTRTDWTVLPTRPPELDHVGRDPL